jgi:hypothetical protein
MLGRKRKRDLLIRDPIRLLLLQPTRKSLVLMTENMPSATDATDTTMGMGPHSRSPPAMSPRDSSLSKWLKDASNTSPEFSSKPPPPESTPNAMLPTPPPANQQALKKAEPPAKANLFEQISDGTVSRRDQPEPSPVSPPPLLKARGRSPRHD